MGLLEGFFKKDTASYRKSSMVAKERLQIALVSDRVPITPEKLEVIKEEIINVISRHFDIDREAMEITWGDRHDRLLAEIPVRRSRRR